MRLAASNSISQIKLWINHYTNIFQAWSYSHHGSQHQYRTSFWMGQELPSYHLPQLQYTSLHCYLKSPKPKGEICRKVHSLRTSCKHLRPTRCFPCRGRYRLEGFRRMVDTSCNRCCLLNGPHSRCLNHTKHQHPFGGRLQRRYAHLSRLPSSSGGKRWIWSTRSLEERGWEILQNGVLRIGGKSNVVLPREFKILLKRCFQYCRATSDNRY